MLKALLRKEFMALTSGLTMDRRKGTKRSKGGLIGMAVLFLFCYISIAAAFMGTSTVFADALLPGRLWLYMALAGLSSLLVAVIGSVFMTYSILYKAKDNEMLLALPITPMNMLISKMVSIYIMALVFSALPIIPALIILLTSGFTVSAATIVFSILSIFFIAMLATALGCLLGWLVALVIGLFPRKNVATVIFTLLFLGIYYFFYFRINTILQNLVANISTVEGNISGYVYPFYKMGLGCAGDVVSFLIFALICLAAMAIVCFVLSRTFIKIATRTEKQLIVEYKEKKADLQSVPNALFRKELKHYLGSAGYLLNSSMGIIFTVVAAVALLIKAGAVRQLMELLKLQAGDSLFGMPIADLLTLAIGWALCFLSSNNDITAPSISLDAKTLWLSKSLPVDYMQIFDAKRKLHLLLTVVPLMVLLAAIAIVLKMDVMSIFYCAVLVILFIYYCANLGLVLNLRFPNLNWTNETMAVKQGASVTLALFGNWALLLILGALYAFVLRKMLSPMAYMRILIALFLIAALLTNAWLQSRGRKRFQEL